MKKNTKKIAAFLALAAIFLLFLIFIFSAFTADADRFMSLLFCMIAIPLLGWIVLVCVRHMQNRHTAADQDMDNQSHNKR